MCYHHITPSSKGPKFSRKNTVMRIYSFWTRPEQEQVGFEEKIKSVSVKFSNRTRTEPGTVMDLSRSDRDYLDALEVSHL